MKRLIVTADDFGASAHVNAAVAQAHRGGILRFASLMADAPAAEEAARMAKEMPALGVGLHLVLCWDSPGAWGARYFFSARHRRSIEPQIRAQIERLLSWGLKPTHADGHMNIHVHPVVFPILARLAVEYGIPRLRLPGGEAALSLRFGRDQAVARCLVAAVFGAMRVGLRPLAGPAFVPPRTIGLLRSGAMSEDYVCWLLERLPEGLTELYFHPSAEPGSDAGSGPTPSHQTIRELRVLTSGRVREALRRAGIELVSAEQPLGAG